MEVTVSRVGGVGEIARGGGVCKGGGVLCKRGIGGNGPPFDQCRDTLSAATYKEKQHMINHHGSKMDKEICKCGGNYGPPFNQCRDTLPAATHKETAYDQS